MPHLRHRKFNSRDVWQGQDISNDLCMVVRAGDLVFVRGQTGMDLEGRIHGIDDPAAQAENAMRCLKQLLEEVGSGLHDICKIVVYVTDRAYREPVYRVIGRWLAGVYPVSTGLIVQGLARPELLMEIDAYAVTSGAPGKRAPAKRGAVRRSAPARSGAAAAGKVRR
jgi:enamine deaminase RidA (YjgF/YER057c/UK114 family)